MLHELLLALAGHPGDIFVPVNAYPPQAPTTQEEGISNSPPLEDVKSITQTWAVAPDFPFLHPSERHILNDLAHLGFLHHTLNKFITTTKARILKRAPQANNHSSENCDGLYLLALCTGLDSALSDYRDEIVCTERKVLSTLDVDTDGGRTPLEWVRARFARFWMVLPALVRLVMEVDSDKSGECRGVKLLDLLETHKKTGMQELRDAIQTLIDACMGVFFKQLVSWLFWGTLYDPYQEFFIRDTSGNNSIDRDLPNQQQQSDTHPTEREATEADVEISQWHPHLRLVPALLPRFVPLPVAHDILFIGKSTVTIHQSPASTGAEPSASPLLDQYLPSFTALSKNFSALQLATVLRTVRRSISDQLYNLVVMDKFLSHHLLAFRAVYLMGNGSFWTQFLEGCDMLKRRAGERLGSVTEHDVNRMFRRIVRDEITHVGNRDIWSDYFTFRRVTAQEDEESGQGLRFLFGTMLKLDYRTEWPMSLVFSKKDFEVYNSVLDFLVRVRCVMIRVKALWNGKRGFVMAKSRNGETLLLDASEYDAWWRDVCAARQMMLWFLDSLWGYMQMDVLETLHRQFMNDILSVHDINAEDHPAQTQDDDSFDNNDTSASMDLGVDISNLSITHDSYGGLVGNPHAHPSNEVSSSPGACSKPVTANHDFSHIQTRHASFLNTISHSLFLSPATASIHTTLLRILALCDIFVGLHSRLVESSGHSRLDITVLEEAKSTKKEFHEKLEFLMDVCEGVEKMGGRTVGMLMGRLEGGRWWVAQGGDNDEEQRT
ncbi:gamma-tubulin complex component protein [Gaertneriomyces semiglobifer]|nr:gamma-tubulin complex component protein [Gaertneriomyces semiglobifer]